METITARNVNDAYPVGLMYLREKGVELSSRNGPVIEYPDPVSIKYLEPTERVLFDQFRKINPFLHFFEPLWILAGQEDVAFLAKIVSRFLDYSDNGITVHGAYGHRLMYPNDQIHKAIQLLKNDPDDRRVVLQIRHPKDMWYTGKDSPCNIAVACKIRNGKLNIHVFNRSNDYIWGMLGANHPQFSTLLEYMAGQIGCGVGHYHQTTDSMHVYTELNDKWNECKFTSIFVNDPYEQGMVKPYPMFEGVENVADFDKDLFSFFEDGERVNFITPYFNDVVKPMWAAFIDHKNHKDGLKHVLNIAAQDWQLVTKRWLLEKEA